MALPVFQAVPTSSRALPILPSSTVWLAARVQTSTTNQLQQEISVFLLVPVPFLTLKQADCAIPDVLLEHISILQEPLSNSSVRLPVQEPT